MALSSYSPLATNNDKSSTTSPIAVPHLVLSFSLVEKTPNGKFVQEKGEPGLTSGIYAMIGITGHVSRLALSCIRLCATSKVFIRHSVLRFALSEDLVSYLPACPTTLTSTLTCPRLATQLLASFYEVTPRWCLSCACKPPQEGSELHPQPPPPHARA